MAEGRFFLPQLSRRRFLAGSAGLALTPSWARAQQSSSPDVVIIGAGAAGLAAAQTLMDRGVSFVLIEARERIGGRAHTETATFGVPYDRGCHWLHIAHKNPWIDYGKAQGFTVYPAPGRQVLFAGDREANDAEAGDYRKALNQIYEDIGQAGERDQDVSAASVASHDGPWGSLAAAMVGAWSMGKDLENFSCVDWWNSDDGEDWFCKEGFGTLVAHYGRDIPVMLNTPATKVRWGGPGVAVETPQGTIAAKAVIVTVSTGVLGAEKIAFDPPVPVDKQEAFRRISMGTYNHIALQFSEDVFGWDNDAYMAYRIESPKGMGLVTNISGTNLTFCFVGGSFGRDLEAAGVEAAVDFGLGELRRTLGSKIDKHFVKGTMTRWDHDPWSLGAYASAEPGAHKYREILRQSLGDRLHFAGEACHRSLWATCAGAFLSGAEVAGTWADANL